MNLMTILSGLFIRKVSPCELPDAVHPVLPPPYLFKGRFPNPIG